MLCLGKDQKGVVKWGWGGRLLAFPKVVLADWTTSLNRPKLRSLEGGGKFAHLGSPADLLLNGPSPSGVSGWLLSVAGRSPGGREFQEASSAKTLGGEPHLPRLPPLGSIVPVLW